MTTHPHTRYRAGVDIGGTFTDLILVDPQTGTFAIAKTLTTPGDPSQAVEIGLRELLQQAQHIAPAQIQHLVHGTTLVTNAIIERKGARTALLATQGFRDAVEIGREQRYELYDLMIEHPKPLAPRYLRFDVPERMLADGSVLEALDVAYVERLASELAQHHIEAVAICFLHSFTNPAHERLAAEVLRRVAPHMRLSLSSEVAPAIREFERTSTTLMNVYVQERVERYLRELQTRLTRLGIGDPDNALLLMLSSGGIATVDTAIKFPVRLLESGPAAGALAAAHVGATCGQPNLLSFDMGGTTAKLCVIADGKPWIAQEFEVDRVYRFKKGSGLPVKIPVIEMIEIGTGGGSLARVDSLGLLKVGPDSAGAAPGPVCYRRGGTQPTVTDADLVLGYLDPQFFLGGRMALDLDSACAAIQTHIAAPLKLSIEEAAWGIHQVANESMANAARVHTLERGKDPHRLPLFVFGGAGPVHAYRVALALGSPSLIAPFGAGVMSTVGFLIAPLAFDFARSAHMLVDEMDWRKAARLLGEMRGEGEALLLASGVPQMHITHTYEIDMRYVGQGHEVRVALTQPMLEGQAVGAITDAFDQVYRALYGRLGPPVPLEIMQWRVLSSGPKPNLSLRVSADGCGDAAFALKHVRRAYFPEARGYLDTPVYDRYRLAMGATLTGPAIVEERESTVIVGPDARCEIDAQRNLVVTL